MTDLQQKTEKGEWEPTVRVPALSDAEVGALSTAYALGAVSAVEFIPQGRVNENFLVTAESGRFVIRRSRARRRLDAVAFEHSLMDYLATCKFPVPPLVPTSSANTWHVLGERIYRVTAFVEGERYDPSNRRHLDSVAFTHARYHRKAISFPGPASRPGFIPILESLEKARAELPWERDVAVLVPFALPQTVAALSFMKCQLDATIAALKAADGSGPQLIVHGSCRLESFIFRDGEVVAMLDYDNSYLDARALDIAIALLSFAAIRPEKVAFDPAIAAAFITAYEKVEPLRAEERRLIPWYARARVLKREADRCRRWLHHPSPVREAKLQRGAARLGWLADNGTAFAGDGLLAAGAVALMPADVAAAATSHAEAVDV